MSYALITLLFSREIAETRPPKTFNELIQAVVKGDPEDPQEREERIKMARGLRNVPKHLQTHEGMTQFFVDVIAFVPERDYEGHQITPSDLPIERRSYFGLFIRRCYLSYFKLSWRGAIKLVKDYKAWVAGKDAGYDLKPTDRGGGLLIMPTASDELQYAQLEPLEKYDKAVKEGDTQAAIENLRRFFDQKFSDNDDSGLSQHALLNFARLHYSLGEYVAARHSAEEALKTARTANDALTVQHCTSLLRRIPSMDGRYSSSRIPPIKLNTSPIDVLYNVRKALDSGEPLESGFIKLYESLGCADAFLSHTPEPSWPWARHAYQAVLWRLAGVESLAQTHENIILAFTEPGDDESRLHALCSKARRLGRQGNYGGALLVLLDPNTWKGINLRQYNMWASEIWEVLRLTASRRRQVNLIRDFLGPRKPAGPNATLAYYNTVVQQKSSMVQLLEGINFCIGAESWSDALSLCLDVLWNTQFRGLHAYHRVAVVLLAEISIEFGMATRGKRIIEEILPIILNGDDLELRAHACYTLARCIMVGSWADSLTDPPPKDKQEAALRGALPFLHTAEADYAKIEMYPERMRVLYTLSVTYNSLDMIEERDRMAELHSEVEKQLEEAQSMQEDKHLKEIMDLVVQIAGTITKRFET
ncbi:hypothetical protein FRC03_012147 [Tulasnella sp. 419]|nr:hypothetical protein FRC03_012147 [Tulasnella sp. 419]